MQLFHDLEKGKKCIERDQIPVNRMKMTNLLVDRLVARSKIDDPLRSLRRQEFEREGSGTSKNHESTL